MLRSSLRRSLPDRVDRRARDRGVHRHASCASSAQVVLRYGFNDPLTWSDELARYLFIWCSFLGWIIASRRTQPPGDRPSSRTGCRRARSALLVARRRQVATLFFAVAACVRGGAELVAQQLGRRDTSRCRSIWASSTLIVPLAALVDRGVRAARGSSIALRRAGDAAAEARPMTAADARGSWPHGSSSLFLGPPIYARDGARRLRVPGVSPAFPASSSPQKIAKSANSFPLLAAPLFILMGNIMNSAGITDAHLRLRHAPASAGCAAGSATPTSSASVIFAGMSGSAVADAGGLGTLEIKAMKRRGLRRRDRGRDHRRLGDHRPDHPALAADGDLRRLGRGLDRRAVPRRRDSRPADGRRADGDGPRQLATGANLPRHPFPGARAICGAPSAAPSGR